ncbi:MAG: DUF167 domain-containing protein [bacterium]
MLNKFIKELNQEGEVYLKIKARPGASENEVKEIMSDKTVKINIAAPSEKGRANQELIRFLAKEFAVQKEDIKILSGAGERTKLVKIKNMK